MDNSKLISQCESSHSNFTPIIKYFYKYCRDLLLLPNDYLSRCDIFCHTVSDGYQLSLKIYNNKKHRQVKSFWISFSDWKNRSKNKDLYNIDYVLADEENIRIMK